MNNVLDKIVIEVLDLDGDHVPDDLTRETADYWDSMNHLRLVAAIEQEFYIKLSMEEISSINSISKLRKIVNHHTSSSNSGFKT